MDQETVLKWVKFSILYNSYYSQLMDKVEVHMQN